MCFDIKIKKDENQKGENIFFVSKNTESSIGGREEREVNGNATDLLQTV